MDEAAHEVGVDPVAFRLSLLDGAGGNAGSAPNSVGGAHRQAAVLARCSEGRLGACHAEGCRPRHRIDVRAGTQYADVGCLRRSRAG